MRNPVLDPATEPVRSIEHRAVEAALRCISRWGVSKTTADDIAREAGMSRATLYRAFPGGRDVLLDAVVRGEADRLMRVVAHDLAEAIDLEDLVVVGAMAAADLLQRHTALQYVLANEPAVLQPSLAIHRFDRALQVAVGFAAPHLARFLSDPHVVAERTEWVVRTLLSYALSPSPHVDLADEASVRTFVRTYLLPVLETVPPTFTKESRS